MEGVQHVEGGGGGSVSRGTAPPGGMVRAVHDGLIPNPNAKGAPSNERNHDCINRGHHFDASPL